MRVLMDEQPCAVETSSVGAAIDGAAALAEQDGRVIVEIVVDGQSWDEAALGSDTRYDKQASEVQMATRNLHELVRETLTDASEELGKADAAQRAAAEHIQADRTDEAMAPLTDALDIWMAVHRAVRIAADAVNIDLDGLRVGDQPAGAIITAFHGQLDDIRSSLIDDDPVRLSDALAYELPECIAQWRELLDAMRAETEAKGR